MDKTMVSGSLMCILSVLGSDGAQSDHPVIRVRAQAQIRLGHRSTQCARIV